MSVATGSVTRVIDTIRARDAVIAGLLVVGALFLLYAMFLDQGGLLAPFFGASMLGGSSQSSGSGRAAWRRICR